MKLAVGKCACTSNGMQYCHTKEGYRFKGKCKGR